MEHASAEDFAKLEDVERKGLGTPATRAGVIEKLVRSGFVERKKKQLLPTEKGTELIKVMPDTLKSAKLTAEWEEAPARTGGGAMKAHQNTQKDERTVFPVFSHLCPVHNPPLQRVIDGVEESCEHKQRRTQDRAPFPYARVVCQVHHKQARHDTGAQGIGGTHQCRPQVSLKPQLIRIVSFTFHCSTSIFPIQTFQLYSRII